MNKSISRTISEFAVNLQYKDLPQNVIHEVKRYLYDSVGCAFGGYHTKDVRIIRNIYQDMGGTEEATVIGSVNTVVNELGKLIGYNTDVQGVYETLLPYKSNISGNEVCVIGAGGSARTVIYAIVKSFKPQKIYLVNRTEQHADSLKHHFKSKMKYDYIITKELQHPDIIGLLNNCALIVNTTPVGMYPTIDDSVLSTADVFVEDQVVFDLVYNPTKTKFLQLAESKNAIALNGLTMLVQQAAKSFNLWTGNEFPVEKVYKSLLLYSTK